MKTIRDIGAMRRYARREQASGKTLGFVPTMGYLHAGHDSLVKAARRDNDRVVVSIFVNPAQFGPREDFNRYPRDFKRDETTLEAAGVDVIFYPSKAAMYPEGYATYVTVDRLSDVMCGESRHGHFRGVTTVVLKLFEIIRPDTAYFGCKDFQQTVIIKKMVKDLNMDVAVRVLPTVREPDGLAMSSRNMYLNGHERADARILFKALKKAEDMVKHNERRSRSIIGQLKQVIGRTPNTVIDYVKIVDRDTLQDIAIVKDTAVLALAVTVGKTRLIDNIVLGRKYVRS
ncbi:MAG: pantoate--beta-alanine ligase [Candidatus Omnitrophica bacterium]|nr:pantoate--beta-alanine ligase [Candidatus Omnitrophota bacterium]